ncbi:ATP-binding protein [Microbacterium sp. PM5]|uniref:AAA family ATPase n=1 Tax=Microbacterium sp. PM5 TaxID=2014534 RepID=UPI000DD0F427|nr:ATP-binding protein [Microbacterium sp. PM5]AXA95949.1 chromosome segregation protein SMC [Microbacterium sp. PM5]
MRIVHVAVDNWRNFKSLEFDLGDRLFVVGPNASGKSNLLDIFRFLADVAGPGGLATAVERRDGISKIRSLFARNNAGGRLVMDVRLKDDDVDWRYRLAIRGEKGGLNRPIVYEELVERDGEVLLSRPDQSDNRDAERLTQTHLEQIAQNESFRPLAEFFSRAQYFHLVPQIIRNPGRLSVESADPYGGDFITRINSFSAKTRDAWLRRMTIALSAAVPEFESLSLEIDSAGRPHLVAGYRNWRKRPARQSEVDFSDGTLRLVGLLWTLVSTPANAGVLLLEEPELSLNAAIVRLIPTMLASVQRDRAMQVVMSTHAPELLDDEGVRASEVLVLRVTNDGTFAEPLSSIAGVEGELSAGLPKSEIVSSLISPTDLDELLNIGRTRR